MKSDRKDRNAILNKLGIEQLNQMQLEADKAILSNSEIVLLSPTGTGKTLAFLLPIIAELDSKVDQTQVLILVPSRELAIQIEQVTREMGSGYKANAIYGGRSGFKDKLDLKHPPTILIGTPGRIADHIRRDSFPLDKIKTLVLDEFDKSLETGFEKEMKEIIKALPAISKKILTSATQRVEIPRFTGVSNPIKLNFINEEPHLLTLKTIISPTINKLESLDNLLGHLGEARGILFCNFKDTIQLVSEYLQRKGISHACFYGGMDQKEREHSLIKFRNGTHRLLVATDLAARGIDVPELDFIIHYQLPSKKVEFTHRNGRTARMHRNGTAYIMKWQNESMPDFTKTSETQELNAMKPPGQCFWETLYVAGGRKDKISKGDIAGLFFRQAELKKDELGIIELKQDCAYVAVPRTKTKQIVEQLNNSKIKKKKLRISILD